MNYKDWKFYDLGNDFNKDKHCDVDGWFVNNEGNHKPILRVVGDNQARIKATGPRYDILNIDKLFSIYGYDNEYEILLPRNIKFRVIARSDDFSKKHKTIYYSLEVIK